jgi:predicted O-methyltransferase YrrM
MISLKNTTGLGKRKKLLWKMIRNLVPQNIKFYYEGNPHIAGQLLYEERKLLHSVVHTFKPINCFEIGTWRGGGSTFFISQALCENGAGILNTIEIDKHYFQEAQNKYKQYAPHLLPYINFNLGDYKTIFIDILNPLSKVDLLMLDGAENAQ